MVVAAAPDTTVRVPDEMGAKASGKEKDRNGDGLPGITLILIN
jgi:hypothetical protein